MGSGLKYTGIGLLLVGLLFALIACMLFAVALMNSADQEEKVLLTNRDFSKTDDRFYSASFLNSDAGIDIDVSIESTTGSNFLVEVSLFRDNNQLVDTQIHKTPLMMTLDLNIFHSGSYDIVIHLMGSNQTLNDLDIEVLTETSDPSAGFTAICCGSGILGPLGILMAVVGTIMLIVNAVKGKGRKEQGYQGQPQYYPNPTPYPQQPNYHGNQYPPQYQQGYPRPGTVPPPPEQYGRG